MRTSRLLTAVAAAWVAAVSAAPVAGADNSRLNNGVVADVYAVQHQPGAPPTSR